MEDLGKPQLGLYAKSLYTMALLYSMKSMNTVSEGLLQQGLESTKLVWNNTREEIFVLLANIL